MSDATAAVADLLEHARRTGVPIAPPSQTFAGLDVDEAYAVQQELVARWTAAGRRVAGHKVGLTSGAMQRQLGVDSPDYGHLFADTFVLDTQSVSAGGFIAPRIEPEIGLVLRRPLAGPGVTVADAWAAVSHVVPALEIIDSRIEDWRITLVDTIADNASSGGVVLGSVPSPIDGIDLRTVGVVLRRNGTVVSTGAGAAVLGSPINALVWLANTIGPRGVVLEPGAVVLPGSLTAAVDAHPGDTVTATFGRLGSVTATFTRPLEEH